MCHSVCYSAIFSSVNNPAGLYAEGADPFYTMFSVSVLFVLFIVFITEPAHLLVNQNSSV